MSDTRSDEALIARAAAGDAAAFDLLASRHLLRLRRAALRIVDDPAAAEDVAQEAMLRAWTAAGRFHPAQGSAATWLHRIAVNLAIDHLRRRRPVQGIPDELADPSVAADEAVMARERSAALASGMAALPSRQRAALALSYGHGLSGAEAARELDVSVRGLEGLLRRGRLALRGYLRARDA